MLKLCATAAALLFAGTNVPAQGRAEPRLCRTVHGRLMVTSGTPNLRIWVIGTRHYLGLSEQSDVPTRAMPASVERAWRRMDSALAASLYGDFRVCAWKPPRRGEMEMVRLIAAYKLVIGPYR